MLLQLLSFICDETLWLVMIRIKRNKLVNPWITTAWRGTTPSPWRPQWYRKCTGPTSVSPAGPEASGGACGGAFGSQHKLRIFAICFCSEVIGVSLFNVVVIFYSVLNK